MLVKSLANTENFHNTYVNFFYMTLKKRQFRFILKENGRLQHDLEDMSNRSPRYISITFKASLRDFAVF